MYNTIFKKLIAVILLTLSPLAMLAIFGAVYVVVQMINGLGFSAGVSSFITLIRSLVPYFSYLTTIPVILILLSLVLKYRVEVRKKIEKLIDRR